MPRALEDIQHPNYGLVRRCLLYKLGNPSYINHQNPHKGGRRELTPQCHPLTLTHSSGLVSERYWCSLSQQPPAPLPAALHLVVSLVRFSHTLADMGTGVVTVYVLFRQPHYCDLMAVTSLYIKHSIVAMCWSSDPYSLPVPLLRCDWSLRSWRCVVDVPVSVECPTDNCSLEFYQLLFP